MLRRAWLAAAPAALLGLLIAWWTPECPNVAAPPADVIGELRGVALPLRGAEPAPELDDLEPLLEILASRRVVALGEATHGTREFFQLKHRVLQLLVSRAGFTTFAIETDPRTARVVNDYVVGGVGDARAALLQLEFWTWQTEEVLALVEWMRAWNQLHPAQPLSFVGINATGTGRDRAMADNVLRELEAAGPAAKMVLWAHNGHVATAPGWMGDYLRTALGDRMYVVGFEFGEGEFRSRNALRLRTHRVGPAGPAYYAEVLGRLPSPVVFLDFHSARSRPAVREWLAQPRRSRRIDELFYVRRLSERFHSESVPWPELYDGILFVRSTHAAVGL